MPYTWNIPFEQGLEDNELTNRSFWRQVVFCGTLGAGRSNTWRPERDPAAPRSWPECRWVWWTAARCTCTVCRTPPLVCTPDTTAPRPGSLPPTAFPGSAGLSSATLLYGLKQIIVSCLELIKIRFFWKKSIKSDFFKFVFFWENNIV